MNSITLSNNNEMMDQIAQFVSERYNLGLQTTCQLIKSGINDSYLITDGEKKFVFRVYSFNWRTKEEIEAEVELLIHLHSNGIPVSYPIVDCDSQFVQSIKMMEGERFGVLFSYALGEKRSKVEASIHFQLGELLGKMHVQTKNQHISRVEYTADLMLVDSFKSLTTFLDEHSDEMKFMKKLQAKLLAAWLSVDSSLMSYGVVHLDIWNDNFHISDGTQITLFDFDFCGNGWLCLDLAYYIMQLHNTENYDSTIYQPKVEEFMKGYESVFSLSAEEKRLIPMLGLSLYFFYLGVQCRRYDWSKTFLNEDYLKRYIQKIVMRYHDLYFSE